MAQGHSWNWRLELAERAIDPQVSGLGRLNLLENVVAFRLTMFLTLFMVILLQAL